VGPEFKPQYLTHKKKKKERERERDPFTHSYARVVQLIGDNLKTRTLEFGHHSFQNGALSQYL
jgi:hypothetical protein